MQLDKYTIKAQEAVQNMQSLAKDRGHQEIDCEHLLLALLDQEDSLVQSVLTKLGEQPASLRQQLEQALGRRAKVQGTGDVYLSQALRKAFDKAESEARQLRMNTPARNTCCWASCRRRVPR